MRVYIWCDGAAMPNGGPAGTGYVVVGDVSSELADLAQSSSSSRPELSARGWERQCASSSGWRAQARAEITVEASVTLPSKRLATLV